MEHDASKQAAGSFHMPVLDWLHDYQKAWLKPDILAGVTAAAVVLPKAFGEQISCERNQKRQHNAGRRIPLVTSIEQTKAFSSEPMKLHGARHEHRSH
jgi:hypothetical protein